MTHSLYDACIVGGGISGLATAHFLLQQQPHLKVLVLEKNTQPGGAIASYHHQGYLAEWGPHGFLDNCKESKELIKLAALERAVTTAPLSKFVRYVCLGGKLNCIPQTPIKIIREPLMPFWAKLRVLGEVFKPPLAGEPSVAKWAEYRFGKNIVPFADAVFTGTYAGDISLLKIDSVMAGVRDMEREHGSIIRGVLNKMRAGKKEGGGKTKKQLPSMTSFTEGMGQLPQTLAAMLERDNGIFYNHRVNAIAGAAGAWQLTTEYGQFASSHLVMALPVNAALKLLAPLTEANPPPLQQLPEAKIASVLLGFDQAAEIPFGFGYLAPESEQRFALGALFSSHMFPGRAPAGQQLLEALVGGRRHPERLELDDREIINAVFRDLRELMPLPKSPSFATILRPNNTIPQMEGGYQGLLDWRRELQQHHQGLHLCGFGWRGIGINDMIKEAWKTANQLISQQAEQDTNEVKGVYF